MGLRQFLVVLRERWRSFAVVVVLGLVATAVLIALTPTTYRSTATLFVTTPPTTGYVNTQAAVLSTQERVVSYAELGDETSVLEASAERLGGGVTADDLDGRVSSQVVPGTLLIEISAEAETPEEAKELAGIVADEVLNRIGEIEESDDESVRLPFSATLASEPTEEGTPVEPFLPLAIGAGLVLSLLTGLCVAVLREVLDTTISTPEHLREITGHSLVTVVPQDPTASGAPTARGPASEAFRVLRTNLQFADLEVARPVVLVTSPTPGEGRTFVASGLATAVAGAGRSVLLIDADLRHPAIAERLGIDGSTGLVNVLIGAVGLDEAIVEHSSGVSVLPSGPLPPNPAEMLESAALRELLASVRGRYDLVVIDAPAVLPSADASILLTEADGAILVVRHGTTRRDEARLAAERVDAVAGRLFGSVLNGSPRAQAAYGYEPITQASGGRRTSRPAGRRAQR